MAISKIQQDNLFKAYGLFIEAFRPYVVATLQKEAGDKWPDWYYDALTDKAKDTWNMGLKSGSDPSTLIDYQNLKSFALKYKDLIRSDFKRDTNKLATQLETIYDVRNKMAHFSEISEDEFTEVFILMKKIAHVLNMADLEDELSIHQEAKETKPKIVQAKTSDGLPAWFKVVTPHLDIRQGRLDESIFAANLAEVALGNGREIYNNPVMFFTKTFFTQGLKNIAKTVMKGLNGKEDAENRVISLQTGFGGGKTHSLISLFHLCKLGKNAKNSPQIQELLSFTGQPEFDSASIAVFTNTTNDPANGRKTPEGILLQTIWGELAYQLGGVEAYEIIRKNDEQLIAPGGTFKKVLQKTKPALILIDELADYCVKASAKVTGSSSLADQTISFMQELTEAVAETNNCVAVVTLPASPQEVGNTAEAQAVLSSLQKRVTRVGADTQPVADDEIYEVIRRRLFEEVGDSETIESVASEYLMMYQEHSSELPKHASRSEYKQKILKSYPFHPELIDVFRIRWASHHDFQRTRGVLRLLAAIISDAWKRQQSLPGSNLLIHPGVINFVNLDALSGQLKKLYGPGYDSVITADVSGTASNSFKIDSNKTEYGQWELTQSISSVILLNSFGSEGSNKGVSVQELKLNLLSPKGFNHNNVNSSLDELESNAYYLHFMQLSSSGKRYWFHTKPNINILINQANGDIDINDVYAEIVNRLNDKAKNINLFKVMVNPAVDIPEQTSPTLIIVHPSLIANPDSINGTLKPLIEKIATKKGNSERIYRNTILFLACSEIGSTKLFSDLREYLACQKISSEYQSNLDKDQREDLKRRMSEASKAGEISMSKAYSIVVKHSASNGIQGIAMRNFSEYFHSQVNENILSTLKEEEWLLDSVGMGLLKTHNLLPSKGNKFRTKDIYEAFLRFDDKPMVSSPDAISRSLLRYCMNGEFAIASGDGKSFNRYYFKENVPFFDVKDESYWVVDKAEIPTDPDPDKPDSTSENDENVPSPEPPSGVSEPDGTDENQSEINELTISGKVPLERYTELFQYFITPFAMSGNKIDIEVSFKIKSTDKNPLTTSKPQYKSAKEAAKQLGLNFDEE